MKKLFFFVLFLLSLATASAQAQTKPSCVDSTTKLPKYVPGCALTFDYVDNSDNESGFHVWRKLNAPTYGPTPSVTIPAGITTFQDSGMVQAAVINKYCWQVTAFNSAGESKPTNEYCYDVPALPLQPPAAATNLTAK